VLLNKVKFTFLIFLSFMSIADAKSNLDQLFRQTVDKYFDEDLKSSPERQSDLGMKDQQGLWDDVSIKAIEKSVLKNKSRINYLKSHFPPKKLSQDNQLSLALYIDFLKRENIILELKDELYLVYNQANYTSGALNTLKKLTTIRSFQDAESYISRLQLIDEKFDQYFDRWRKSARKKFLPPKFAYDPLIKLSREILIGKPFDESSIDSPLLGDFKNKLDKAGIKGLERDLLLEKCIRALLSDVKRAYEGNIEILSQMKELSSDADGLIYRPNGKSVYKTLVKYHTTTNLSPEEVHQIGLREVKRIHKEIEKVSKEAGVHGSLQEIFHFLRNSSDFNLPNTDKARLEYLKKSEDLIAKAKSILPKYFSRIPKADVIVRRVDPIEEATAPPAYYYWPSADGTRPGYYFLNLGDMSRQSLLKLNVLAIHEALPGHHMQLALEMEMGDLPKFRKQIKFIASYQEGWGMYAEFLGKEMGLYEDHWMDLGRLSLELWRAIRLVVDTGIHAKGWTREKAFTFALNNSPEKESEIKAEVDRFVLWPGQATGYKIGMLKIIELRRKAETILGSEFNLSEFHDETLRNGSVPLNILENEIAKWISRKKENPQQRL
jgi:uncharacterized protein (DUF885 family)